MSDTTAAQGGAAAGPSRQASGRKPQMRLGLIAAAVVLGIIGLLGFQWWTHGRFVQSTSDAYLQADLTTVAPKVSGYVDQVFVRDNQAVEAGQPLVHIDPRSYDAALAQQAAAIDERRADIAAAQRQVQQQEAAVAQAGSQLDGARANAVFAEREAERFKTLSAQGVETQERYAQAVNQRDQMQATLKADEHAVQVAERQAATLKAQIAQAQAQLEAAQAGARGAELNVGDTLLRASIAGRIGDRTVRVGQFVQPGVRLMSIVPVKDVYLVANFKETQIARMRVGQHATVKIDALDGKAIDAVIDSFAPGTGAQFALLPPENATGNFTKIVQRVPVRLKLLAPAEVRDRLLPGLSAAVKIDTSAASDARR